MRERLGSNQKVIDSRKALPMTGTEYCKIFVFVQKVGRDSNSAQHISNYIRL